MKQLYPIKCNGKVFPAGEYKGGLPEDVEQEYIGKGYFDVDPTGDSEQESDGGSSNDGLTLAEISVLKISDLKEVVGKLETEEIQALITLEQEKGEDARAGALEALYEALN